MEKAKTPFMSVFLILLTLFVMTGNADDGISKEKCTTCASGICATDETLKCDCVRGYKIDISNKNVNVFPKAVASLAFVLDMSRSMQVALTLFKGKLKSVFDAIAYDRLFKDIILTSYSGDISRLSHIAENHGLYDNVKRWVEREFASFDNTGCRHYVFSALKKTAEEASKGSVIYLLTDSSARDATLSGDVSKLLKDKEIRLFHLKNGRKCSSHDAALDNLVKTYGWTYNLSDKMSDQILRYLRVAVQYGMSFIRSPPKKFEDLKYIGKGTCKCKNVVVKTTQCRKAFPSPNTKYDGVKLDVSKIGNLRFEARLTSSVYMPSRAIDFDYETTYAYAESGTEDLWLMVQLWRSAKIQSVSVGYRPRMWLNDVSGGNIYKKISVGLSDKDSVWSKFVWKEFKKCGSPQSSAVSLTKPSLSVMYQCTAPLNSRYMRYVAVYKEAIAGTRNILSIYSVQINVLDGAGKKVPIGLPGSESQMNNYKQKAITTASVVDGDYNTYYRSMAVSARDQYFILDIDAFHLISKIVLHRRRTEEARLQFRGIFVAISYEPMETTIDKSKFHQCGDFYEGPPAASVTSFPFYCTLNKKTRVVGVLKTGVMELYNIIELTEIEVYVYRAS